MQDPRRYLDFSVNDFACDEYFQDWVRHPTAESDSFWTIWLQQHPEQQVRISDARLLLMNLAFRVDPPKTGAAAQALKKAWEQIEEAETGEREIDETEIVETKIVKTKIDETEIDETEIVETEIVETNIDEPEIDETSAKPVHRLYRIWRIAAIWIFIVGTGIVLYQFTKQPVFTEVATAYGRLDTLVLPDQSQVVLNANSSLSYKSKWKKTAAREVWLKGEALFNIQHLDFDRQIEEGERFLVHVGRATIEVLGTSFNVRQRRDKVEIALLSGSIRLHIDHQSRREIIMKPGELLITDTTFGSITRAPAKTENSVAWTHKRLVLNNPTLEEIVADLEDTYGKKIVLGNSQLASRKVEGPILLDSLDDALFVLSTVLNVEIIKKEDYLLLQQR